MIVFVLFFNLYFLEKLTKKNPSVIIPQKIILGIINLKHLGKKKYFFKELFSFKKGYNKLI